MAPPSEINRSRGVAADQAGHEQVREHPDQVIAEVFAIGAGYLVHPRQPLPSQRGQCLAGEIYGYGGREKRHSLARDRVKDRTSIITAREKPYRRPTQPDTQDESGIGLLPVWLILGISLGGW